MRSALLTLTALGSLFAFTSSGAAQGSASYRVECSAVQSRILDRRVPYCVMLPPSYARESTRHYPVSYFLHGLGDNEQSLINMENWGIFDRLLNEKSIGEFVVIAPAGLASFYINSRDGKFRYEDFFFNEFLPAMEKQYRIGTTGSQRGVMGVSMGGYGALHYAFKYPQRFSAVSASMPALMDQLPRELADDWLQTALGKVFGDPPDPAFLESNSPLHLARIAPSESLRRLSIYFDCGAQDRFGFEIGTGLLDKLLTQRGVPHETHIYPGGHDWRFVQQHFASALESQSRGLGAK